MQVFRLVKSGWVDKVIAFDELPKRFLQGVEMKSPAGLPRHWKAFLGEQEKVNPTYYEKNPITGKVEKIGGDVEKGPFFYILYYTEINKDKQRWEEISSFVRRAVELRFRLMDKLEDMALPMGVDAKAEITLEPEHLEENGAIIPIPIELQEKTSGVVDAKGNETPTTQSDELKCDQCDKTFKNERGLEIHKVRMHA